MKSQAVSVETVICISMNRLSEQKELELCGLYGKLPKTEIMSRFGLTNAPIIYRILRRHGIQVKSRSDANIWKREINLFTEITEEWQAYFLGLLFSDGNLYKNRISISLVEEDFYIVKKICKFLFVKEPRYYHSYPKTGGVHRGRPQLCMSISNVEFSNILQEQFNVQPNKSLICPFPRNIPSRFIHHFIRGYFDGDGCIKNNGKRRTVSMLGSQQFLEAVKSILRLEGIEHIFIKQRGNIYSIYIYADEDINRFYTFLYKDATLYLKRKQEKFIT